MYKGNNIKNNKSLITVAALVLLVGASMMTHSSHKVSNAIPGSYAGNDSRAITDLPKPTLMNEILELLRLDKTEVA